MYSDEYNALRDKVQALRDQLKPLAEELHTLKELEDEERDKKSLQGSITLEKIMALDFRAISQYGYDRIRNWYYSQAEYLGVYPDGLHGDQYTWKIRLNQNEPLDIQLGIKALIPLLKPVEGKKRIDIFRYDLCERGIWSLIDEGGNYSIYSGIYVEYEAKDLDDALEYIYKHHPYVRKDGTYDEWEDEGW